MKKAIWNITDNIVTGAVNTLIRERAGKGPQHPGISMGALSIDPVDETVRDTISYNNTPTDVEQAIPVFSVPAGKILTFKRFGIIILDQVALSDQINYLKWFDWRLQIGAVTAPYYKPTSLSWTEGQVWADFNYDVAENQMITLYVNRKSTVADPGAPTGTLNIACRIEGKVQNNVRTT